ncbi:MAG: DUF2914 domain-containing protein [Pseudomonadota bacterium]
MNKHLAVMLVSMASLLAMPLAYAQGDVARTIITTEVVDREPVNELDIVPTSNETVLFFTELRNMEGQTVLHRWMLGGESMAEVSFNVGGPRWRVWSSKQMLSEWTGLWTVQVVDATGQVVAEKSFTYGMADAGTGMATEEAPMGEESPVTEVPPAPDQEPAMESTPSAE